MLCLKALDEPLDGIIYASFIGLGYAAASLHGIYDFLVLRHPVAALPIAAAMIGAIWLWRLRLMHRMHEDATRGTDGPQPRS
ncbi:MAG: hypothetical protein HKO69_05530 [Woeseiaceae bacterium]|nr:hypothetical protein [Woeseiaceae bacterium]